MNFGAALAHFTCVFDYKGGTYVRQFPKDVIPDGIAHAITDVLRYLDCPLTDPDEQAGVESCWQELVAVEGTHGVWYNSLLAHDDLLGVLVIRQ